MAVSTGCPLLGSLQPHGDPDDQETLEDGANKRMGQKLPEIPTIRRRKFLRGLEKYVKREIKRRGITPIAVSKRWTVEEYLAHTNYPQWRKDQLLKYYDEVDDLLARNRYGELIHFTIKLFMKDEHYADYKHVRGIYARDEAAKLTFGPWFKMMEEIVYAQPEFIKHVPVAERPDYISKRLVRNGARYVATDYSSFEAHFGADMMEACEFVLYKHLLSRVSGGAEVLELMKEVLQGNNVIVNKFIKGRVIARRMSGEMNTSLGNGWSNLMFMGYICELNGLKFIAGVVEGDDGLFSFIGPAPTTEMFTHNGFIIKLDVYDEVSEAGFCGQLFDEEDRQVVTDPRKVVSQFGWTSARYSKARESKLKMLLRAKALSMAHQYPGCPIIGAMAQYGLRVTRSYDVRGFMEKRRDLSLYEYEKFLAASRDVTLYQEPGIGTRLLFEKLYNITIEEQREIENYFSSLQGLAPLDIPALSETVHESWGHYWDNYVTRSGDLESNVGCWYDWDRPDLRRGL